MDFSKVPLQTVERLSRYRRVLADLQEDGVESVFSHRLAELMGVTPAQVRRICRFLAHLETWPVVTT